MLKKLKAVSVILCFSLIASCASYDYNKEIGNIEKLFYSGKFKAAARKLLPMVNKESKDQLLFMMECGLILHTGKEYQNSNKVFLPAAKKADQITKSIKKQAASLLLNETTTNYNGEDFERVLIHMYAGINYLMLNQPDEARVEFKKVNDLLREINVQTGKNYKQNIMAKYLTAIAFELIADMDNDVNDREFAYIEYKQIYKLMPTLKIVQRDLQRLAKKLGDDEDYNMWVRKFGKLDRIPKNAGELIVIFQNGKGPIKKSRGSLLKDPLMNTSIRVTLNGMTLKEGVTIAAILIALKNAEHPIPKFIRRNNNISYLKVEANNRTIERSYQLENVALTAIKNLEDDYKRIYAKVAAGIAVKAATAVATGIAAKKLAEQSKKMGGFAGLIGAAVGTGVGVTLVSQIKPDLRCWHTLPDNFQISRAFLPEGKYTIKLKFYSSNGQIIKEVPFDVEIKKGKKTFINYRTF